MECVSIRLSRDITPQEAIDALRNWKSPLAGMNLPTAPERPLRVYDDERFPQPRRHAMAADGMQVSIGRVRACSVMGLKFVVLSHNTIRGAAGGAILNAELLVEQGRLG